MEAQEIKLGPGVLRPTPAGLAVPMASMVAGPSPAVLLLHARSGGSQAPHRCRLLNFVFLSRVHVSCTGTYVRTYVSPFDAAGRPL
jgi:hypothetical protein